MSWWRFGLGIRIGSRKEKYLKRRIDRIWRIGFQNLKDWISVGKRNDLWLQVWHNWRMVVLEEMKGTELFWTFSNPYNLGLFWLVWGFMGEECRETFKTTKQLFSAFKFIYSHRWKENWRIGKVTRGKSPTHYFIIQRKSLFYFLLIFFPISPMFAELGA